MQWAIMSSGRVMLNDPRKDFASGVRAVATNTASFISNMVFTDRLVEFKLEISLIRLSIGSLLLH